MKIRLANWFWLRQYCSASAASTRQSDSRKPVCWEWRQHRRRGGSPHPARPRSSSSFYTILQIQPEKYEARKQKKLQVKSYTHEICLTLMPFVDLLSGMPWPCSCCGCAVCQIIPVIVISKRHFDLLVPIIQYEQYHVLYCKSVIWLEQAHACNQYA